MKTRLRISGVAIVVFLSVITIYLKGHYDGETGNSNIFTHWAG